MTRRLLFGVLAALYLASLAGCTARYVRISEKGMTCVEAHQVALNSVGRMGYTVKEVTKPTPGAPGIVVGERTMLGAAPQDGQSDRVFVQVFCTSMGSEVEVKAEGPAMSNLTFSNDFKETFNKLVAAKVPVRAAAEAGVDVLVKPERANGSDLGVDLTAAGVMPVSLRITNNTKRTYKFRAAEVVLQSSDGKRVEQVSIASVAGKLPAEAVATLKSKAVADKTLKPGETLSGYMLFPFGGYERARVTLEDVESEEEEGFSIEL